MKIVNYWERFLSTGKIDDYLAYRGERTDAFQAGGPGEDEGAGRGAGTYQCHGDDFKDRTHRGV